MKIVGRYSLRHAYMPSPDARELAEKKISEKEFLRRVSVTMYNGVNNYIRSVRKIDKVVAMHNKTDYYNNQIIPKIKNGAASDITIDLFKRVRDDSKIIEMILYSRDIKMSSSSICMKNMDKASQYLGREITAEELTDIMNGSKKLQKYIWKNYLDSLDGKDRMATPEELADYMRLIRRMVDSGRADRDNFDERLLMLDLDGNVDEEDPYARLYEYDYSVLDNVPDDFTVDYAESIRNILAGSKHNENP